MKQLLLDFLELDYDEKKFGPDRAKDIVLGDLIVSRLDFSGYTVNYLFSGASLFIPWAWMDLFDKFNVHSGHQILGMRIMNNLDKFIYLMTDLQQKIMANLFVLEILGDICNIGTKEFRETIRPFPPFEYSSRTRQIEI